MANTQRRRPLHTIRRMGQRQTVAALRGWDRVVAAFNALELSENAILLAFAVVVGAAGAFGVVGFYKLIDLAFNVFFRIPSERLTRFDLLAYRPLLTGAGFLAAWWIMHRIGRGHDGLNVPDVQLAVARRDGIIPPRPAFARTAASAVTLGSGGSAGSEGPVAVLGSSIGSVLGTAFNFDPSRTKVLVAAGAAAGISATFNAPLAGAFFALEEILGSFAVSAFPPVVVSSVIGAVVSHAFFGNNPAFPVPTEYGFHLVREVVLFYPLLGILAGIVGAIYVRVYFGTGDLVRRIPVSPPVLAVLGGIVVGVLVFLSGGSLGGYGHLAFSLELFGRMSTLMLVLLAAGKIVATSLTLNTGASGGVFTPSLYIGAATGGAYGVALSTIFPSLAISPEAYALVGMGALVAAATDAPLTGILLVFEMTNDYAIMMPLMIATVIAYVFARQVEPDSLYSGWLRRRGETIEHGADRDLLGSIRVAEALVQSPHVIGENASVSELIAHLADADQTDFPVVDTDGMLVGLITVADLGRVAADQRDLADVLVAADIARPTEVVSPDETLLDAVRRMGLRGTGTIPVVEPESGRLVGLLHRTRIFGLYERAAIGHAEDAAGAQRDGATRRARAARARRSPR